MRPGMNVFALSLACNLTMGGCKAILTERGKSDKADLQLAASNQTDYVIVKPSAPTPVDEYALTALTNFLFQKTGAAFPVVLPGQEAPANKHIFVGLSAPALKITGPDPLAALKDQEYVARSAGADIVLYGKGIHGNLYAVLDFMEITLGRRWYSKIDKPFFSVTPSLPVKGFARKGGFSFPYRFAGNFPTEFDYQLEANMGLTERSRILRARGTPQHALPPGVVSQKDIYREVGGYCHTSFCYIPPKPGSILWQDAFAWVENKNYFQTNPEFFTMNQTGQRTPDHQLCFSNPGLRKELTRNIEAHISRGTDFIALDANDNPGDFCFCPACNELKAKYRSPGGPLYDFLLELCATLKTEHPGVMVRSLAYRRNQTQKPPVLPAGKRFPDNFIVLFANVEDRLDVDWDSPVNHATYEDLVAWRKLTAHLWTWYYPNPYCAGASLPFANLSRLANDLRLMKKAGVEGVFYEFTTFQVHTGDGFTEIQRYLHFKLTKDIDADSPALIKEFTDDQYGAAAPLCRKYLDELVAAEQKSEHRMPLTVVVPDFDKEFSYLTHANIRRWQGYFDQMEKDVAGDARCLKNVRRLRRALEFATLGRWNEIAKAYPDYFKDYRDHKNRLGELRFLEKDLAADYEILIQTAGKEQPLPEEFKHVDQSLIRRFVPVNMRNGPERKVVVDPAAAFGYAATVDLPDMPFNFGFYQTDAKAHGPKSTLAAGDIKPGVYRLYQLGEIKITPDCYIWFSSKSWCTLLQLGSRLYEPGEPNRWEAHVSLKFDGPTYGGNAKDDVVLCDQIIFVKKSTSKQEGS